MRPRTHGVRNATWGLLDQGLYSASNLLLTIVVVRSVAPAAFGAFSLCYVVYMLSVGLSRVTGSKPYTIEATGTDEQDARSRASSLLGYAAGLGGVGSLLCLAVALAVGSPLSGALVVLALLMPGLLLQDAVRGLYFARLQARGAFLNDALWTVLQAAAIVAVLLRDTTPPMPLLLAAWGVPAAVAAAVGVVHLRVVPGLPRLLGWLRPHLPLAGPLAVNLVLTAAPSYLAYLAMPAVSSLDALAVVRGAYVFFGPLNVLYTGAAMVALPAVLRVATGRSRRRMSLQLSALLATSALAWAAVVVLLPDRLGTLVLGELWAETETTRLLLGISLVAEALLVAPEVVLASLRMPRKMTTVRAVGALVTLVASLVLAARYGAEGLAGGFALGYSVAAVLATVQVVRVAGAQPSAAAPAPDGLSVR